MNQHMYLLCCFLLGHLYSRHLVSSLRKKKKMSISKGFAASEVRKSWAFSLGLPCHKRRRSTYIEIISSGGTVLLPLSTNILIPQIQLFEIVAPLRFLNDAPSISERHVVVGMQLLLTKLQAFSEKQRKRRLTLRLSAKDV